MTDPYLLQHSGHDAPAICERWIRLADKEGWIVETIATVDSHPILVIQNQSAKEGNENGFYLSAGVHGDECAPVLALLEWAEGSPKLFETHPVTIFPCFNPVGLLKNERHDGDGIDLNRNFQNRDLPVIRAWQDFLGDTKFLIALSLHEDYDARGVYLYELTNGRHPGNDLLSACEGIIPRETQGEADGNLLENGIMSRGGDLKQLVEEELDGGYPEAIWMYIHHTECALTFETPSEFSLVDRVKTQRRFLENLATDL